MTHTKSQPSLKGHARPRSRRNSQATPPKTSARKQVTSVKLPLSRQTVLTGSNNQKNVHHQKNLSLFSLEITYGTHDINGQIRLLVSWFLFFSGVGGTNQPTNQKSQPPIKVIQAQFLHLYWWQLLRVLFYQQLQSLCVCTCYQISILKKQTSE